MELYNGDEYAVWEEFIADIFADMNKFSDSYIDTAVDYWYNDKIIDRYNPSEYIKPIDSGGNEAVLDNIGFGNEYSLSGNSFDIPYNKKCQLDDYVLRKNHNSNKLEKVDRKEIGNNFYVWENNSKTDYTVVNMMEIYGNEDLINDLREVVKNGTHGFTKQFGSAYEGRSGNGRRSNSMLNAVYQRRKSANGNGGISSEQSTDNTVRRSKESGGNKQTKYALNSYDADSESLTPERKKAIFEQWEKDRGFDEILLPNEITPKEVDEIVKALNAEATDKVQQALIK